ncbi:MAG: rhodanese-like domain-containing protein [Thermoplasmatota archaeon]
MKKTAVAVTGLLLLASVPLVDGSNGSPAATAVQPRLAGVDGLVNISVHETWEMLQNESDGREAVIDVRTFPEWFNERIATPHWYDKPILYPLHFIEIPLFRSLFRLAFEGNEVILYCRSANRSCIAGNLLVDEGFVGTVYNMAGGIVAWKAASLPVVKGFGFGS